MTGKRRTRPCRIVLRVHGLEWCLFNRTPAFDEIITRMEEQEKREAKEKASRHSSDSSGSSPDGPRRRAGWKADDVPDARDNPAQGETGEYLEPLD